MSTRRRLIMALLTVLAFFALVELGLGAYAWLGFGGPRWSAPADGGQLRVLALGDSFTYGQYVDPSLSYPAQLQGLLAREHGRSWEIVNDGVPGRSPTMILHQLEPLLQQHRPDLVVLLAGYNVNDGDILAYRSEHGDGPQGAARALITTKQLLSRLRSFRVLRFVVIRGLGGLPSVGEAYRPGGMDLFDFRSYQLVNQQALSRLVGAIQGRGIPLVLMNYPQAPLAPNGISPDEYYYVIYAGHLSPPPLTDADYLLPRSHPREMAINGVIRQVAAYHDVPLVDHFARFSELPDAGAWFIPDDEHPNGRGYGLMVDELSGRLVELGLLSDPAPLETP